MTPGGRSSKVCARPSRVSPLSAGVGARAQRGLAGGEDILGYVPGVRSAYCTCAVGVGRQALTGARRVSPGQVHVADVGAWCRGAPGEREQQDQVSHRRQMIHAAVTSSIG